MRRTRLALAAALLSAMTGACAFGEIRINDPLQREISLEDAQHRYTVLVRWSDFEKASKFVDPEQRAAYLSNFPDFREIRFTEYQSEQLTVEPDLANASVDVTYYAYTTASPVEATITETQHWYRDPGVGNHWFVRSTFSGLDAVLGR